MSTTRIQKKKTVLVLVISLERFLYLGFFCAFPTGLRWAELAWETMMSHALCTNQDLATFESIVMTSKEVSNKR